MNRLIFTMNSFSPTQGQWWADTSNKGIERRVSPVAAQFGFYLWTAEFRDTKTGRIVTRKWFCSAPGSNEPLALFETIGDRHRWMEEQWRQRAVAVAS